MSRVAKNPVTVPAGVEVKFGTEALVIKGKNGEVYGYGVTLKAYPAQINKKGDAVSGRGWMTALKADTPPHPPKPQPDPNPPSDN